MFLEKIGVSLADRLKNEYALLSVLQGDKKSTMTISWGGFGILWGKEVCFIFVRPERYTYSFLENSNDFSLSFFNAEKKDALIYCGRNSGKDVDKFKECSLDFTVSDNCIVFNDATLTLKLKKLYAQSIEESDFIDTSLLVNYKNAGYHKMYVCEITDVR